MKRSFLPIIFAILMAIPAPAQAGWFSDFFASSKGKVAIVCAAIGTAIAWGWWKKKTSKNKPRPRSFDDEQQQWPIRGQEQDRELKQRAQLRPALWGFEENLEQHLREQQELREKREKGIEEKIERIRQEKIQAYKRDLNSAQFALDSYNCQRELGELDKHVKRFPAIKANLQLPQPLCKLIYGYEAEQYRLKHCLFINHPIKRIITAWYGPPDNQGEYTQIKNVDVEAPSQFSQKYDLETRKLPQLGYAIAGNPNSQPSTGIWCGRDKIHFGVEGGAGRIIYKTYYKDSGQKDSGNQLFFEGESRITVLSGAGDYLAAGSEDGHIRIWDLKPKEQPLVVCFQAEDKPIIDIYLGRDLKNIVSATQDSIKIWEPADDAANKFHLENLELRKQELLKKTAALRSFNRPRQFRAFTGYRSLNNAAPAPQAAQLQQNGAPNA